MSLKDLTAAKHELAEQTKFMRAVFDKVMPKDVWTDFTYQKWLWYATIESKAAKMGLITEMHEICRSELIYNDFCNMNPSLSTNYVFKQSTREYNEYLQSISDPAKIMAHLYTWHMGDMYGGQMISKIIDAPHTHLIFNDRLNLISQVRAKLTDSMADEANIAFDWAIRIMSEYDNSLG